MCENPCKTCKRVENPDVCALKQCAAWQKWFVERWKGIHYYYKAYQKITGENVKEK